MQLLIWVGVVLTLAGVGLILWLATRALALRRLADADHEVRTALSRLLPLNFAALGLSFLGLALVLVGILLG